MSSTTETGNGASKGQGLSTKWDPDLEKGDLKPDHIGRKSTSSRRGSRRESVYPEDYSELDEYTALQKFIVTYRDPRAQMFEDEAAAKAAGGDVQKKAPWYAFWRKGGSDKTSAGDPGTVPDDWLESDFKHGISAAEVENRRKRFGFNELTTEKENMFIKFLTFFTGPILYGTSSRHQSLGLAGPG